MIAGQSATFSNNLDDVFKYDPTSDEWTQISHFLGQQEDTYGVCEDDDGYCGFGSDNFGQIGGILICQLNNGHYFSW